MCPSIFAVVLAWVIPQAPTKEKVTTLTTSKYFTTLIASEYTAGRPWYYHCLLVTLFSKSQHQRPPC